MREGWGEITLCNEVFGGKVGGGDGGFATGCGSFVDASVDWTLRRCRISDLIRSICCVVGVGW